MKRGCDAYIAAQLAQHPGLDRLHTIVTVGSTCWCWCDLGAHPIGANQHIEVDRDAEDAGDQQRQPGDHRRPGSGWSSARAVQQDGVYSRAARFIQQCQCVNGAAEHERHGRNQRRLWWHLKVGYFDRVSSLLRRVRAELEAIQSDQQCYERVVQHEEVLQARDPEADWAPKELGNAPDVVVDIQA